MIDDVTRHCEEVQAALRALPGPTLERIEQVLLDCYHREGTIFICGNGGSAATASHFACDLGKGTRHESLPRLRVVALTDSVPSLTAWANDHGYECIFAEQLASLGRAGDVLVIISGSGNSPNVVNALKAATNVGMHTIALTGRTGGHAIEAAELTLRVPADHIEAVEDSHSIVCHGLTLSVRRHLLEQVASAG